MEERVQRARMLVERVEREREWVNKERLWMYQREVRTRFEIRAKIQLDCGCVRGRCELSLKLRRNV